MIILDTNVVSEPMKPKAAPEVLAWLDRQVAGTLFLTTVSLAEVLFGLACLPSGRRREEMEADFEQLVAALFGARLLPFDSSAARFYSRLCARARAAGTPIAAADGYIAAIAASRGFAVATRDVSPFEAATVSVINPWIAT